MFPALTKAVKAWWYYAIAHYCSHPGPGWTRPLSSRPSLLEGAVTPEPAPSAVRCQPRILPTVSCAKGVYEAVEGHRDSSI